MERQGQKSGRANEEEPAGTVTRVLVAASSALARTGMDRLLEESGKFIVAGSARNVDSLMRQFESLRPDVVVLDFEAETEDAIQTLLSASKEAEEARIVALSPESTGRWVGEALRSGVRVILPHDADASLIVAGIEAAVAGLVALTPEAANSLYIDPENVLPPQDKPKQDGLTARELEVLGMVAEGLGNKAIAYRLGISEHTVKFHIASILSKLMVSSRTEAVTVAIRRGLLML